MADKRPTTIDEYIESAPQAGQPHLRSLFDLLKSVAPQAEHVLKWNTPFFIEPRFLFAFSAHKAHLGFSPSLKALEPFRLELEAYEVTKAGILKIPYNKPLPEQLIRQIATHQLQLVREREDQGFW